jgi:hypothetical protein
LKEEITYKTSAGWEDNIKMDLGERNCEMIDLTGSGLVPVVAFVNTVMNIQVSSSVGKLLTSLS